MANLNASIQLLAESFAAEILAAVRGMSLDEILGDANTTRPAPSARSKQATQPPRRRARPSKTTPPSKPRKPGRPPKVTVDTVVAVLKQHANGLRAAELRKAVGVKRSTWKYLMPKAIAEKRVGIRGTKSNAVYFAT